MPPPAGDPFPRLPRAGRRGLTPAVQPGAVILDERDIVEARGAPVEQGWRMKQRPHSDSYPADCAWGRRGSGNQAPGCCASHRHLYLPRLASPAVSLLLPVYLVLMVAYRS